MLGAQVVDGLPPSVLLVGSEGELVGIFDLSFLFDVEMSISLGLLVVAVLVDFKLVELMGLGLSLVLFAVDVEVVRDGLLLGDLLKMNIGAHQQNIALMLSF